MKAVLWIMTLVFGSLFGLSIGLLCGAIFGLGLTIGWDARTAPQDASANAAMAAETMLRRQRPYGKERPHFRNTTVALVLVSGALP
jgi:hypothetical protein